MRLRKILLTMMRWMTQTNQQLLVEPHFMSADCMMVAASGTRWETIVINYCYSPRDGDTEPWIKLTSSRVKERDSHVLSGYLCPQFCLTGEQGEGCLSTVLQTPLKQMCK